MEPDDLPISDTDSFGVKVYKSVQTSATTDNSVDIWAAIDRHFYQNGEIIATHRGQTRFYPNGAGFNYRFKREVTRPDNRKIKLWPREGSIDPTSTNTEHSEDFPVNLNGQGPGLYESWAYTRIEVKGEGTTATSTESFYHWDNIK